MMFTIEQKEKITELISHMLIKISFCSFNARVLEKGVMRTEIAVVYAKEIVEELDKTVAEIEQLKDTLVKIDRENHGF